MKKTQDISPPERRIADFIRDNSNMTLATSEDGRPWCAHCFYAYQRDGACLVFKSDADTHHIRQALRNPRVAGTIAPDRLLKKRIQGVQFRGEFITPEGALLEKAQKTYYAKYPFARLIHGDFWLVALTDIKMTDNTLGFARKLSWTKQRAARA